MLFFLITNKTKQNKTKQNKTKQKKAMGNKIIKINSEKAEEKKKAEEHLKKADSTIQIGFQSICNEMKKKKKINSEEEMKRVRSVLAMDHHPRDTEFDLALKLQKPNWVKMGRVEKIEFIKYVIAIPTNSVWTGVPGNPTAGKDYEDEKLLNKAINVFKI